MFISKKHNYSAVGEMGQGLMHNTQALLSKRPFLAMSQPLHSTIILSQSTEYTYVMNLDVKYDHVFELGPRHFSVWKVVEALEDKVLLEKGVTCAHR